MKYYRLQNGKVFEICEYQFDASEDMIVYDDSYKPIPEDWWVEETKFLCGVAIARPYSFIWRNL